MLVDNNGETIIHQACKYNYFEVLEEVIKREADLNTRDNLGKTPLLHAAENGHTKCVVMLLAENADPTIGNKWNAVALHYACSNGHLEASLMLLKHALKRPPAGILMQVLRHGRSKLFDDNIEAVNLLKEECCLNYVDSSGETPLFKACYRNHLKIVKALVERGADITIKAGEIYPFNCIKPGKELEKLERIAAKVSRLLLRIKYENSIDVDKDGTTPASVVLRKKDTKEKRVALNELSSLADTKVFLQLAVVKPHDFEINIRDISNKIRLLTLRRLDVMQETKAICAGPYQYHKTLKARVINLVNEGLNAYRGKDYDRCGDNWELATQYQQLKDWIAGALLRDKPLDKEQSDRLYDVYRLFSVHQTQKTVTQMERSELIMRVAILRKRFDNNDKEYELPKIKRSKKKMKKKNII